MNSMLSNKAYFKQILNLLIFDKLNLNKNISNII